MKNLLIIGCLLLSAVCNGQTSAITPSNASSESILLSGNDYQEIYRQSFDFGLTGLSASHVLLKPAPIHLSNPFMSGMFCTMETKIESKSKLAPRFRLGSLNYTEWMEGKKEMYMRYWK